MASHTRLKIRQTAQESGPTGGIMVGYTKSEIRTQCEEAFRNTSTFYKKDFINYRGKTTDTKEYYTEVVAEFLCERISEYVNGIECISRKSSYKTEGHDGMYDPDSNREEEKIAMQMQVHLFSMAESSTRKCPN